MYDWLQVTIRPHAHVYRLIPVTLTVTHRPCRLVILIAASTTHPATAIAVAASDSREHVIA